ncbi:MAG: glycosyltransferase family protein [Candidatus Thorarchaeota archaeon]|nr:glycosyltransferase family protein [Candidatus Thorarchaeota archaeon]
MKSKIVAVIQARMRSSRFPGKPLEKIGEWSLIELVLRRVSKSSKIEKVILATSSNPNDDILATHVESLGFPVFRGSENDVLSRFYEAAREYEPLAVVRITGDCPLISPSLIDYAIENFAVKNVDYLTISIGEEKERAYPRGFDVEVASFKALTEAVENASKQYEREHVMPYLYTHRDRFSIEYLDPSPDVSRPRYRLCVDTKKDLEVIMRIYDFFKGKLVDIEYKEIISFLDRNPDVHLINQSVKQKHYTESDKRIVQ